MGQKGTVACSLTGFRLPFFARDDLARCSRRCFERSKRPAAGKPAVQGACRALLPTWIRKSSSFCCARCSSCYGYDCFHRVSFSLVTVSSFILGASAGTTADKLCGWSSFIFATSRWRPTILSRFRNSGLCGENRGTGHSGRSRVRWLEKVIATLPSAERMSLLL